MVFLRLILIQASMLIAASSPGASSFELYQTTRQGDRLKRVEPASEPAGGGEADRSLRVDPGAKFQTVIGIGGSFTEAGAQVLSELSEPYRQRVLRAYFAPEGARYSLARTHVASCDFSVTRSTYAPVPEDRELRHFSIDPDRVYLLPLIQAAMAVPGADFKILASPWTAPPWMKTNGAWNGGRLKEEHYGTFAAYLVRYLRAYAAEGVPIWGLTPMNEPLGNAENWESTHFSPGEMARFIGSHLGPALAEAGLPATVWAYDQNRGDELVRWADALLGDPVAAPFIDGMAIHWYDNTVDVAPASLDAVQAKFPGKAILHTEGCIDAVGDDEPVGSWLEDDWFWREEATDWGFRWAPPDQRDRHPKYRPFFRYARELIGGFNHHLVGWIDWNLVLNTRGGPNHARNFCLAPVLVESGTERIYFTPLFYTVAHFSRFVRPGARRIGLSGHDEKEFMATAFENPDGSVVVQVLNLLPEEKTYRVELGGRGEFLRIPGEALQTVRFGQSPGSP